MKLITSILCAALVSCSMFFSAANAADLGGSSFDPIEPSAKSNTVGCYVGASYGAIGARFSAGGVHIGENAYTVAPELGCDYRFFGPLVVGAFVRYDFTDSDEFKNAITLGARLGYLVNRNVLAYVVLGAGLTDLQVVSLPTQEETAVVYGGGLEVALAGGLSAKLEYTRYDYGSVNFGIATAETDADVVRLGVSYSLYGGVLEY